MAAPSELAGCMLLLKAAVATWEDKFLFEQLAIERLERDLEEVDLFFSPLVP